MFRLITKCAEEHTNESLLQVPDNALSPVFSPKETSSFYYYRDSKTPLIKTFSSQHFFAYYSLIGSVGRSGVTVWNKDGNYLVFVSKWPHRGSVYLSELILDMFHHFSCECTFWSPIGVLNPRQMQTSIDRVKLNFINDCKNLNQLEMIVLVMLALYQNSFSNRLNFKDMDFTKIKKFLIKVEEVKEMIYYAPSRKTCAEILNFCCISLLRFKKGDFVWISARKHTWEECTVDKICPDDKHVYQVVNKNGKIQRISNDIESLISLNKPISISCENDEKKVTEAACIACTERGVNAVFIPCGHLCMCIDCAEIWGARTIKCPICQQNASVYQVYAN